MLNFSSLSLVVVTVIISGLGEAVGALYASKIWAKDKVSIESVIFSLLGYIVSVGMYWISIKYFQKIGIVSTEIQMLGWFTITIVGIALISGQFLQWKLVDQVIAFCVVLGIGWLFIRTGG